MQTALSRRSFICTRTWLVSAAFCLSAIFPCISADSDLDSAIGAARDACIPIASEMHHMKVMAGINTAVTGVGTLAGGGALATGLVKSAKDKEAAEIEGRLELLRKIEAESSEETTYTEDEISAFMSELEELGKMDAAQLESEISKAEKELDELTAKSKKLGNWRTGLLAGNTATNIAGAAIAGTNKVDEDLRSAIGRCKAAIKAVSDARMQAHVAGTSGTDPSMVLSQDIITNCKDYDLIPENQINAINNRAAGAQWSSIAGAGMGAAGIVASAVANTDKTRAGDAGKEKNLNIASNVLAGGAATASAVATGFNAAQIAAIKKISDAADKCKGAFGDE